MKLATRTVLYPYLNPKNLDIQQLTLSVNSSTLSIGTVVRPRGIDRLLECAVLKLWLLCIAFSDQLLSHPPMTPKFKRRKHIFACKQLKQVSERLVVRCKSHSVVDLEGGKVGTFPPFCFAAFLFSIHSVDNI